MERLALRKYRNSLVSVFGTVSKIGNTSDGEPTILLTNLIIGDEEMNHMWILIEDTKLEKIPLGKNVTFTAMVRSYESHENYCLKEIDNFLSS